MCNLTVGFGLGCNDTIGGVKALYFADWADVVAGVDYDNATGQVEVLPTMTIYKYVPHRNTGNWVEETTANLDTGSVFWTSTISASLKELSQTKQTELQNLAYGRWIVFVEDANRNIWMVGAQEGVLVSGGNGSTGAAKGDLNGYTLTLSAEDRYRAPRLEAYTTVPFDNATFGTITIED
jgi:hypothetical protein